MQKTGCSAFTNLCHSCLKCAQEGGSAAKGDSWSAARGLSASVFSERLHRNEETLKRKAGKGTSTLHFFASEKACVPQTFELFPCRTSAADKTKLKNRGSALAQNAKLKNVSFKSSIDTKPSEKFEVLRAFNVKRNREIALLRFRTWLPCRTSSAEKQNSRTVHLLLLKMRWKKEKKISFESSIDTKLGKKFQVLRVQSCVCLRVLFVVLLFPAKNGNDVFPFRFVSGRAGSGSGTKQDFFQKLLRSGSKHF